jgi:hypothetical protein
MNMTSSNLIGTNSCTQQISSIVGERVNEEAVGNDDDTLELSPSNSKITLSPDSIPLFPSQEQIILSSNLKATDSTMASSTERDSNHSVEIEDISRHILHYNDTIPSNLVAVSSSMYTYPEDEEGEPVVDDEVLQSLLHYNREKENDVDDGDDELNDPVMLECDKTVSTVDEEDMEVSVEDEPIPLRQSLLSKHGRHPSTIIEEQTDSYNQQQPITPPRYESPSRNYTPLSISVSSGSLKRTSPSRRNILSDLHFESPISATVQNHVTPPITLVRDPLEFIPYYSSTRYIQYLSRHFMPSQHVKYAGAATWIGFWALLHVTCANYMLTPMRDAIALHVGVQHIPKLTLASTVLAVFSSVPIGWLFEAPDPSRRRLWKRMGLTRGETQGTSLALFYRVFALLLIAYAVGFQCLEWIRFYQPMTVNNNDNNETYVNYHFWIGHITKLWSNFAPFMFIAFFLVVHLMKLHCLSLVWGVTTEAMEYEEVARKQLHFPSPSGTTATKVPMESQKMRLKRLSLMGFGGTLGGIIGSMIASTTAQILKLPGLLLLAAFMLEISAELSIELGRIMKKHWEGQQQLFQSSNDLVSLDHSMLRSSSLGSMKRISSGNSLSRVRSASDLVNKQLSTTSQSVTTSLSAPTATSISDQDKLNDDSFSQRMVRGITTIFKSRLLMAIFTYNALYASTTVLLSFQRAELIANRNDNTNVQADTAFLANINMASSAAIFALQASGIGAYVAHSCGPRTTLALMPLIRLLGVVALAWWHRISGGQAPNLTIFLIVDECCKIMNLAVAKPVRESLWRGLSNEARYEAKPIVDTLANRWGGGSAAFLVSFVDKTLDLFGGTVASEQRDLGITRTVFGFPPVLFLCVIISAWWTAVSADLGQIRKNIDIELKKRQ